MEENLKDLEKIEKLRKLRYIGDFPKGVEVLLVSLGTATEELKLEYKDLTDNQLKKILDRRNILVFNNIDQWVKFKEFKDSGNTKRRS